MRIQICGSHQNILFIAVWSILILPLLFQLTPTPQQPPTVSSRSSNAAECIKINELVHKTGNNQPDWIELFNQCEQKVDLAGLTLEDSSQNNAFSFGQLPCEHKIGPKSYLLLKEDDDCSFKFGLGSNDQLNLYDPFVANPIDGVKWREGDVENEKSWARVPDGIGDFQNAQPTPGRQNRKWRILDRTSVWDVDTQVKVVINEVVSSPQNIEGDWIEFYNAGKDAFNLTGFWLTDAKNDNDRFVFGEPGCEELAIIAPKDYLVLYRDRDCSFGFGLGKSDNVTLWMQENVIIDQTSYGPIIPLGVSWGRLPNGADGSFITLYPTPERENTHAIIEDQLVQLISKDPSTRKNRRQSNDD